jgi:hypothetical protein
MISIRRCWLLSRRSWGALRGERLRDIWQGSGLPTRNHDDAEADDRAIYLAFRSTTLLMTPTRNALACTLSTKHPSRRTQP